MIICIQDGGFPVVIFNPGGGFTTTLGNGYYGNTVVSTHQSLIFVWVNYRVGVEGYLSLPGLNAEGNARFGTPTSGNFGLHDLIVGIQWVKQNIQAFGGNPEQITFAGASAGSINTAYVLTSPLTRGLIRGVIMNAGAELPFPTDLNTQTALGLQIADAAGCSNQTMNATEQIACMRNLTEQQATNAYYNTLPPFTGPNGLCMYLALSMCSSSVRKFLS